MVENRIVEAIARRGDLMRELQERFPVGQVIELEGWQLRVLQISPPTAYRDYALVDLAPLKLVVPARVIVRMDGNGVYFRVPDGWKKQPLSS